MFCNCATPYLQGDALNTMCGAILQRGCVFASRMLNAVLGRMPLFFLKPLVDVIAAFDSVIHPVLTDLYFSDKYIASFTNRLNLSSECFSEACEASRVVPTSHEAGVPDQLRSVLSDILIDNCFPTGNANPFTIVRSTKQVIL